MIYLDINETDRFFCFQWFYYQRLHQFASLNGPKKESGCNFSFTTRLCCYPELQTVTLGVGGVYLKDNIDEYASGRDLKYDKSRIKFEYTVPDDLEDYYATYGQHDNKKSGEDKIDAGVSRKV